MISPAELVVAALLAGAKSGGPSQPQPGGLAYNRLLRRLEQFLEQRGLGNSELAAAIRSAADRYPYYLEYGLKTSGIGDDDRVLATARDVLYFLDPEGTRAGLYTLEPVPMTQGRQAELKRQAQADQRRWEQYQQLRERERQAEADQREQDRQRRGREQPADENRRHWRAREAIAEYVCDRCGEVIRLERFSASTVTLSLPGTG